MILTGEEEADDLETSLPASAQAEASLTHSQNSPLLIVHRQHKMICNQCSRKIFQFGPKTA